MIESMTQTYGIKFAGSKLGILPRILANVKSVEASTVLDAFTGTTHVSQYLAQHGYSIISNDISPISKVFGQCYLLNTLKNDSYTELITHLNNLTPIDGWFTKHYGGGLTDEKKPFQLHVTRKLDAILEEVDKIFSLGYSMPNSSTELNDLEIQKSTILCAVLLALDKVDSTVGHQVSYLRKWSNRSFNPLVFKVPEYLVYENKHKVLTSEAYLVKDKVDLAYIDPPYGSNNTKMPSSRIRYNSYYHLYRTVVLNDKPELFGNSNRRVDSKDKLALSEFESTSSEIVKSAFTKLFKLNTRYFLFSYNSTGKLHVEDELIPLIKQFASIVSIDKIPYKKNAMANMSWSNTWLNDTKNFEYLILAKNNEQ